MSSLMNLLALLDGWRLALWLLLANGIDIYAISKRLGHSSTATTSKIYAYLIDEYKDETDKQITKALSSL